jgi:hypothetical protein
LQAIDNAFDKLRGGDLGGLDDLSGIMERLKVSSLDTVGGIDVLASSIQEQLLASGMNASQLDAFVN